MSDIKITADDFQKFREFFYRKTGIQFEDSKRYFVDKRLIERIEATRSANFRSYFTMLRFQVSEVEVQTLTNLMTINETYFFRESYQFDCLVNSILDDVISRKPRGSTIRIWSIPSSSGEEPYSIVLYLLERWAQLQNYEVEVLSSDIDTHILEAAKRGIYNTRAVHALPPAYLAKYFKKLGTSEWQISQDIRDSVDFSRVNLADPVSTKRFRNIDIVFCRNLLIYFDTVSRRDAAQTFFDAMNPGGFVCLGHSESMSRISNLFTVRRFSDAFVYQKPL
jgi:chemotaxis protein methyltransferase CheR